MIYIIKPASEILKQYKMMKRDLNLFLLAWCIMFFTHIVQETSGKIFSEKLLKRLDHGLNVIDLNSEVGMMLANGLGLSRFRRDDTNARRPKVNQFDLKNDTSHNQALIHWSGENSSVVFILTRKKTGTSNSKITESTLWRSNDYGATYQQMGSNFEADTILKSYFVCPTDKKKVIFVDTHGGDSRRIWISEDEGESYNAVKTPFGVEKLEFHPEKSDWLLGYDKILKTLYCSTDFGKHWTKLHNEVTNERYYWYVKGVDTGENAESIVHFEYRDLSMIPHRIYKVKSCYTPKCTKTRFQDHSDSLQNIDMDSLVVQDDYVFVQKAGASNRLYVSYKRGPFVKAKFPYYTGNAQSHFHVVSSDGECVVIGVNHANGLTHLFFSNLQGDTFTQSLSNVRYYNRKTSDSKVYTIDIHEVQGVVGTYICNVHMSDSKGFNITKITWDNGRIWSDITEVYDLKHKKLNQADCAQCQLNLHLSMDQTKSGYYMPSIVTKKSVPGLIIAHGIFGRNIVDNPDSVTMYTSNDNGKSWYAARDQRHLVVIADHGAVIVAIKMIFLKPVKELDFSSDSGQSWTTYPFTNEAVNVDGILTEPGESTHYLTLFGHKTYADSWRIFQLDMSPLFTRDCSYPQDFENITLPSQLTGDTCHLGLKQKVERLKINSSCLVDGSYKRVSTQTICKCTDKDYECDLGYISEKDTCKLESQGPIDTIGSVEGTYPIQRDQKCDTNSHKNISSGFRRIPGDKCRGELYDKLWMTVPCNPSTATIATTTPKQLQIQLVNKTSKAKMGENLMFSIQGADSNVVWHIIPPTEKEETVKIPDVLTLHPQYPGRYMVQVSLEGQPTYSNMIEVAFWYPIEKIYLYHPPVVARNKAYNATAWIGTTYGLRGNQSMLGEVEYVWDTSANAGNKTYSRKNQLVNQKHDGIITANIRVTAENTVSLQTASGKVYVKEFVETLVLELQCEPERELDHMTDLWLEEFQDQLKIAIFTMEKFPVNKYNLQNEFNFFVYVPPASNLQAYIYLVPRDIQDTKDTLLKGIMEIQAAIHGSNMKILLAHDYIVTVKNHYTIDHDGVIKFYQSQQSSANGGVIAIGVIVAILILVVLFFILRRYLRNMRFDRYLHFRNLRASSGGTSHIVKNHDRAPIVGDEFIDDDLDAMEGIGSQDATLQFQG